MCWFSRYGSCFTRGVFFGMKVVRRVNKALKRPVKTGKRPYASPSVGRQKVSTGRQVDFGVFILTATRLITNLLTSVISYSE